MKYRKSFYCGFVFSFLLSVLFISQALAVTITVCSSACDYTTIQAGINAAVNNDLVLVSDGTYLESINFNGKAITVQSVNGPTLSIIDGQNSGSVVTFATGEGTGTVLTDLQSAMDIQVQVAEFLLITIPRQVSSTVL